MRLSDIMSATGLHGWAEIGLVISFLTFVALLVYLFVTRRGRALERERWLPLDGDETNPDHHTDPGDRP